MMKHGLLIMLFCVALLGGHANLFALSISVPPGTAASGAGQEPVTSLQQLDLYTNCKLSGILNNPNYPECIFGVLPAPTATDFMGTMIGGGQTAVNPPLVGVGGGTIIDAHTIEQSMQGSGDSSSTASNTNAGAQTNASPPLSSQVSDSSSKNNDPMCHNGIYSDGCEEGGRTLKCAFIPTPAPMTLPWIDTLGLCFTVGMLMLRRPRS